MTLGSWLAAADGDSSGFWLLSLVADLAFPESFVWGQMAAAGRLDAQAATDSFSSGSRKPGSNLGDAATTFLWGDGRLADSWPAAPDEDEYSRVRDSNVETLLIGGELDFATPPQGATEELLPHLPNGQEVVLPGFGHSTSFWTHAAGSRHPSDQHLPRRAARSTTRSTSRRPSTSRPRSPRRRSPRASPARWSASRLHGRLAALDGSPGAQARTLRTQDQRDCCDPCTRSCSAWADGSLAF